MYTLHLLKLILILQISNLQFGLSVFNLFQFSLSYSALYSCGDIYLSLCIIHSLL